MNPQKNLFTPIQVGALNLPNRIVMAPMTRSRAVAGNVPRESAALYYAQRASAGLIIAEATQISPQGQGYVNTPGIHSADQIAGWQKVTTAVHRAGGRIFLQLWHVGRISHPSFHNGALPVAPSAVLPTVSKIAEDGSTVTEAGEVFTANGMQPMVVPRALESEEIPGIVEDFRQAAINAQTARFDGVELHAANGYLIEQFLLDGSNRRTDRYGGSFENRACFLLDATAAVCSVLGGERVGVRLSPNNTFNGMSDTDRQATFSYATEQLNRFGLAYLHVLEPLPGHAIALPPETPRLAPRLRQIFKGALMLNGGYTKETGNEAIRNGAADLVSFGVPFLANPDLPERFRVDAPLNQPNPETFYAGGEEGYTDYSSLKIV